jgi:hypothetical protein
MAKLGGQRGQALPAVLAILLLVSFLAGGLAFATSAVLTQQQPNRGSLYHDLQAQNAVAAAAADVAGGRCGSPVATGRPTLFADNFAQDTLNQAPPAVDWVGATNWMVTSDPTMGGSHVLVNRGKSGSLITPQGASAALKNQFQNQPTWNYSVSAQVSPGSLSLFESSGLQALVDPQTNDYFSLMLVPGNNSSTSWSFERVGPPFASTVTGTLPKNNHRWHTLEIDAQGSSVWPVIDGQQLPKTRTSRSWFTGSVKIQGALGTAVGNVYVDVLDALPTATFAPPTTLPSLSQGFYCQRIDNVDLDQVVEHRAALAAVSGFANKRSAGCLVVPGGGQRLDIWLSVASPSTFTVSLVAGSTCSPGSPINLEANCTDRNPVTTFNALTLVAVDCTTGDANPHSYDVQLTPNGQQSWPAEVDLRSAPVDGDGSVYMTAAPTGTAGGAPYEQADFLMRPGGSFVLGFEAQLG